MPEALIVVEEAADAGLQARRRDLRNWSGAPYDDTEFVFHPR